MYDTFQLAVMKQITTELEIVEYLIGGNPVTSLTGLGIEVDWTVKELSLARHRVNNSDFTVNGQPGRYVHFHFSAPSRWLLQLTELY